jgi:hypothetical protein
VCWEGRYLEGDTIYSQSEVLSVRESGSRPDAGIVEVRTTGFNQEGTIVISFERTLLVYRRGARHQRRRARLAAAETANMVVAAGQTAAGTESIACLSNCTARSSPEWTMWLCMDRRAASASRARRFSSIAE